MSIEILSTNRISTEWRETCSRQRNSIKLLKVEDKRLFEVRGRGEWEDGRGAGKAGGGEKRAVEKA